MLNGDFTAVPKTLAGGFVGNRIDPKLFSPGALALVKNVPLGQDPATGIVYYSSPVTRGTLNEGTARIDWQVNQAQRLSVPSFIDRFSQPQGSIPGNIVTAVLSDDGRYWNEALNHTWILSPRRVNSFSAAWIRMDFVSGAQQLDANGNPICLSQFVKISDPISPPRTISTSFSRNFCLAITQSWNFSVEQQFTRDIGIHLAYVGNESYHLLTPVERNPGIYCAVANIFCPVSGARSTFPQFGSITEYNTAGTANYQSLQAGIEKRLRYGLQLQSNFT